ncbi:hypothetical protein BCR41DRAFT_373846 [Lobosporangium transversale]|uniref:Uncharacterized protein n=1 Tax=Lobosporangium transversale TaxID=64571 RepID=A0A1Y2GCP5_9FUNG|nr:hypothetical protein BCR41DRAFT_373846 [Lobosporangium transversale]ORZ07071.1 hypothetical protein BCR41DRAFT_373846 [Lobosporangium transversale]|eukprot:XP_021877867.1 hypothetical protein BCR41DRAFT_373846 [Lobosporangium transversale]
MGLSASLKRIQSIQNSLSMHTGAPGGVNGVVGKSNEAFMGLSASLKRIQSIQNSLSMHTGAPGGVNGVVGKSNEAFMGLSASLKRIQSIQNSLSMHTGAPGGGQCTYARACPTRRICEVFAPLPPAVQRSVYVSQRMTTTYSHHPEPAKYAYWRSRRGSVYKRMSMLNWTRFVCPSSATVNGVVGKSNEAFMGLSASLKRIQSIQNSLSMHTGAPGGGQCTYARACPTRRICEVFAPLPPAVQRSVYVSQRMTTTYSHHPEPAKYAYWRSRRGSVYKRMSMLNWTRL